MLICCKISHDEAVLQRALSLCSQERRRSVKNIKFRQKKEQKIAAGVLLRYCLLKNGYDDADIKLLQNKKP